MKLFVLRAAQLFSFLLSWMVGPLIPIHIDNMDWIVMGSSWINDPKLCYLRPHPPVAWLSTCACVRLCVWVIWIKVGHPLIDLCWIDFCWSKILNVDNVDHTEKFYGVEGLFEVVSKKLTSEYCHSKTLQCTHVSFFCALRATQSTQKSIVYIDRFYPIICVSYLFIDFQII
jgi:hypothetical protein